MRGVVRCDHCGAPHRRESATTRFRCDWCGGDNRVEVRRLAEELLLAADDRTRDPATRVREALGRRGLVGPVLHPQPPRWVGVWQIVNEAGEEFTAPVRGTVGHDPVIRAIPPAPLKSVDEEPPGWVGSLPPRPAPDEDSETVVEAARADFDDPEAAVTLVRLVWMGVAEFVVSIHGESFHVAQILGTDRVIFERAPAPPALAAPSGERLGAWLGFLGIAVILGLLVDDARARATVEAGWLALGLAFWFLRREARPGVRS